MGYKCREEVKTSYVIGIDTGGTFTDVAIIDEEGVLTTGKAPSTPPKFEEGILNALQMASERLGTTVDHILKETSRLGFGTTVALNVLCEHVGAKVGFFDNHRF